MSILSASSKKLIHYRIQCHVKALESLEIALWSVTNQLSFSGKLQAVLKGTRGKKKKTEEATVNLAVATEISMAVSV